MAKSPSKPDSRSGGDQIGLVVETGCIYFSELTFPDLVTAQGFFIHVYVDRQSRRPKPLNEKLRAVLEGIFLGEG